MDRHVREGFLSLRAIEGWTVQKRLQYQRNTPGVLHMECIRLLVYTCSSGTESTEHMLHASIAFIGQRQQAGSKWRGTE